VGSRVHRWGLTDKSKESVVAEAFDAATHSIELHASAAEILAHKMEGRKDEALAGLTGIHTLREELSEKLNNLAQS
jgi:hypothetical protein